MSTDFLEICRGYK